ncbi:MAG: nucleoside monophosphate kinase [Patescibacteria group bacterium]
MQNNAVILYGPPGSGKGTQAYLLGKKRGLNNIDTGSILESIVHDPKNKNDAFIQEQRKRFDGGELCDPDWVLKIFLQEIKYFAKCGMGIILSGSLRTKEETFDKPHGEGVLDLLVNLYGKENLYFFHIAVSEKESITRNSKRKICSVCGASAMPGVTSCAVCRGKLRKRKLDVPRVIKHRYEIFKEETLPVIRTLEEKGYNMHTVNGALKPYQVFQAIDAWLS